MEILKEESEQLNRELADCRSQNRLLSQEIDKVKKDQEDLLVLLADQDAQIQKYRDRLKCLNQTVLIFFFFIIFFLTNNKNEEEGVSTRRN